MNSFVKVAAWSAALFAMASPAFGRVKDIHPEKLPQVPAVQQAYQDVDKVEDMVRQWSDKWRYDTPKKKVALQLKKDLSELQKAAAAAPDNTELLLLTGLVAHYAYNLDVENAHDIVVKMLNQAQALAPNDPRGPWFLAIHECQTFLMLDGMKKFLAVEQVHEWRELPANFWDDYLECSVQANMPAHGLRAADHILALKGGPSPLRDIYIRILQERITQSDPSTDYTAKQVWTARQSDAKVAFTDTMHGFAFVAPENWKTSIPDIKNGLAVVQFETGPYAGNGDQVIPNILILARPPKTGEGLEDFLKSFLANQSHEPVQAISCPVQECLAVEALKPKAYGKAGDGHGFFVAFKRNAPEYPGLIFEQPSEPPKGEPGKVQYYHPNETMHRLSGPIYYLVLLDTAASVRDKAMTDFESFLKSMQLE
jgi:hypothetical protein